jgi:spermidine synthase
MKTSGRGLPLVFYPIFILYGVAAAISLLVYFRMHISLFGVHQFSVNTILCVVLFSLAIGSRIGGRLADKYPGRLVSFAVLQGLAGVYALLHPFVFSAMAYISDQLITLTRPSAFGMGFIRPLVSLVFIVVPAASVSASIPVLGRFFTGHIIQTGNRLSILFSWIFAGVSIGMLLSGFLLTRHIGLYGSLLLGAVINFSIAAVCLIYELRILPGTTPPSTTDMARKVRRTAMIFKKRKPVLETAAKLTRAMIWVHALNGFASAGLLILAFRIAAEHALVDLALLRIMILSVFFAGMLLGSALYKRITARMVNGYLMMASLEILTGFLILFSFILYSLLATNFPLQPGNYDWYLVVLKQLLLVVALLLLPAVITGVLLPLSARIYPKRLEQSGKNTGRLGHLFFMGTLFGVLVTRGILFPFAGTTYAIFIFIGISLLGGFFLLLRDSRLIRGFRLSYTAVSILFISGILFFADKSGWFSTSATKVNENIIGTQHGSTSQVTVKNDSLDGEGLYIDGVQNILFKNKTMEQAPAVLSLVLGPTVKSAMVIGFGTGIAASTLENLNVPAIFIDDIYPEVLALSANVFSDENQDILTSSRVDISTEDPRVYLWRNARAFDLILAGFTSGKNVPSQYTRDFYHICHLHLSPHGRFSQILPLNGISKQEFRSVIRACADVFPSIELWYLSDHNVMLTALNHRERTLDCTYGVNFASLDQFGKLSRNGFERVESLLGNRMMDDRQLRILSAGAPPNTDAHPYVEFSKISNDMTDPELILQLSREISQDKDIYFYDPACGNGNGYIQEYIDQARTGMIHELTSLAPR